MNEKEFLEQIRKSAETITPPESLSPENMEKMLHAASRQRKKISLFRLGGIAAAFVVAITGAWTAVRYSLAKDLQATETLMVQEDEESASYVPPAEVLTTADSYEALYDTLYQNFGGIALYGSSTGTVYATAEVTTDMAVEESGMETSVMALEDSADLGAGQMARTSTSAASENGTTGTYSTTNVQENGVDEADIVKTDGNYIYVLQKSGTLSIFSVKDGLMEHTVSVDIPVDETIYEMYVDGDQLSFITEEYYTEMDTSREDVISSRSINRTKLYTYDISDRKNPVLSGTVTQDGRYTQSRKNGDFIYLFTRYSPIIQDTYETSDIVPSTSSGKIEASSIYLPENLNYSTYLVVSSVDIHNPGETINQKAVISAASTFYASTENIYIANENWSGETTRTELLKLHYENGIITGTAAGSLEGYLNDSFSLNEYNGYLRAVTTSYDEDYNESNGLYILDETLQLVGAIRDLAPDETVRSARFMGDTGYFVTFRQTDPLFSVDLSAPTNPQILGDLKVTGFSSYLHFCSEDLLLGLGYEADPETGIQTGLKLSMFDISDPANVTEVSKLVLDGITWCESLNNYKSILMDPAKNIFGFTCDNRYLIFSYDEEKGFVKEFVYDFYNDLINGYSSSDVSSTRGLYINDTLYLVCSNVITSFDMENDYAQIGQIAME